MPKVSLEEKRLQNLRAQLFGKQASSSPPKKESHTVSVKDEAVSVNKSVNTTTLDNSYLKQDLLKIALLSTLAVGVQLALYLGSKNNLINLHFLF